MNSLYITSLEPQSGKTPVALAIFDQLAGRMSRVNLFRPVINANDGPDRMIALMSEVYHLQLPPKEMYGLSIEVARSLLTAGQHDEVYARILERYKSVEQKSDFILCVGSDYTGVSKGLEFDFNVEVARNLGSPVLAIVNGQDRDAGTLVQAVQALFEALHDKNSDILAVIVNRVRPTHLDNILSAVKQTFTGNGPVYVLPEEPMLSRPSVHEIAAAIRAELISGDAGWLDGEVKNIKVASMELPHFLDYLEDGSLVITSGDRSDIILGTLAADRSETYPRIAGLVLTGNLRPAPQTQQLLSGLRSSPLPVMVADMDTYTAAIKVNGVRPSLTARNGRKVAAVLGKIEPCIDTTSLLDKVVRARSDHMTPVMFQYELLRKAKAQRKHIVLPEGAEERILRAAEIILFRDVCDITLLGDPDDVRPKAAKLGVSLGGAHIIDPRSSGLLSGFARAYYEARKHKGISEQMARDTMEDGSYFGTMMVHLKHADGMVSGSIHTTAHTVRPALEFVKTKAGISTVSSSSFMCLADRVLVYADCAIVPDPTVEQLADIAISSASTAAQFGIHPRVAMLSYSTGQSGSGPEVERVREATQLVRERRPDIKIEGPIQYDAAIEPTVAQVKLPGSEVAGTPMSSSSPI